MNETVFYKLTHHDMRDDQYGKVPPAVIAERPSISELVALALMSMRTHRMRHTDRDLMARSLAKMPTPEDLPLTLKYEDDEWWTIEPVGERSQRERLTISVGRDTAQEARDALAWFQLGQTEPVTIEVEDDCLFVYLDDCKLSIGVTAETGDEIYVDNGFKQFDVNSYLAHIEVDLNEHDDICDTVRELMQNLAGFHYLAGAAAISAISGEARA